MAECEECFDIRIEIRAQTANIRALAESHHDDAFAQVCFCATAYDVDRAVRIRLVKDFANGIRN